MRDVVPSAFVEQYRREHENPSYTIDGETPIEFNAGLCETKPHPKADAINNDNKNNPIRRLFDLSGLIFYEMLYG